MNNAQATSNTNPASSLSTYTKVRIAVCLALLAIIIIGGLLWKAESE